MPGLATKTKAKEKKSPLVQKAGLKVGKPGSRFEQEADQIARQVTSLEGPNQVDVAGQLEGDVQPKCTACGALNRACEACVASDKSLQRAEQSDEHIPITRMSEAEAEVQTQTSDETPQVTPQLSNRINNMEGRGEPLTPELRAYFEPRFGADFSDVRIHTDSEAEQANKELKSEAFTVGKNVAFGNGQYSPETTAGKKLLGHELTHVMQQGRLKFSTNDPTVIQGFQQEALLKESSSLPAKKRVVYPPVYWSIDRAKKSSLVIPKKGATLRDVAKFLYGDEAASTELASVNSLDSKSPLATGSPLTLTGKKLTPEALKNLRVSPKVPLGVTDIGAFLSKKKTLDNALETDFNFIIKKLDETHYSDSDENEVISILRKWGKEKFTLNPQLYPLGGEYLDKLFSKLSRKRKDVGKVTTQWTNYYSLIFNHFDRVDEVRMIRDIYSKRFKGDRGLKELSFGSFFWKQVKEGKIRDQIFAYFKGLGKGIWSGAKGTVMMAYTLVTDPKKFWEDLKKLPSAVKTMWENRSELWKKFTNASPEEQAEMIGQVFGEIEFMIASAAGGGAAAKGVEKLTQIPGTVGKIAKATQVVTKLPQKALGAVAKGVKTTVVMGVKGAAEGAKFAARGIYTVGGKVLRGTWSVVEKIIEKIKRRLFYYYDDATKILYEVPAKTADDFIKCSVCHLTTKAILVTDKNIDNVLASFKRYIKNPAIRDRVEKILKTGAVDETLLKQVMEQSRNRGAKRILRYIEHMAEKRIPGSNRVLSDLAEGGGKFTGAEWVLRYIDRRRPPLWDSITKLEAYRSSRGFGGRYYDAIIGGIRYQFKSWMDFYPSTFFKQIRKDYRIAFGDMSKIKWVFEGGKGIGTKRSIIKRMEKTLRQAVKEGKMREATAERIINSLPKMVEVRKLLRR